MTTSTASVAVLGLGRMGTALARRFTATGATVTAWSRHSTPPGIAVEATVGAAVRDAGVVVLALFDGPAGRKVLEAGLDDLPAGGLVVNTSTVAPEEAVGLAALVTRSGRGYLHCPVLGSVPAVETGTLTLLAGAAADAVPEVLSVLGPAVACGDTATAARLKLLANGVLADLVVSLGAALARGDRLGVDPDLVLDVLADTAVGGLIRGKRAWLAGGRGPTTFAAAALVKDVELLVSADPSSRSLHDILASLPRPDDADLAALSAALRRSGPRSIDPMSHLDAAAGVPADEALLTPLIAYARGHATGYPAHFRSAFRPTARVEGIRDGAFVSWTLDDYCGNFAGTPAADEATRRRTITELRRRGTVAHAEMLLEHGSDTFTDLFVLVENDGTWRIASKVYDRRH